MKNLIEKTIAAIKSPDENVIAQTQLLPVFYLVSQLRHFDL